MPAMMVMAIGGRNRSQMRICSLAREAVARFSHNSVIKIDALHICQGELVTLNLRHFSRLVSCGFGNIILLLLKYELVFVKATCRPLLAASFYCICEFVWLSKYLYGFK